MLDSADGGTSGAGKDAARLRTGVSHLHPPAFFHWCAIKMLEASVCMFHQLESFRCCVSWGLPIVVQKQIPFRVVKLVMEVLSNTRYFITNQYYPRKRLFLVHLQLPSYQ